ncbi:MAG: cation:proton antiporter [Halothece sp.]
MRSLFVDTYIFILLVIGLLLLFVTLGSGVIARLPLSFALIYLIVGGLIGYEGIGLFPESINIEILERLTEFVVIVSVFSCGLKMVRPLKLWAWQTTIRLIGFLMPLSIVGIAAVAHWLVGLNWGAAILLGAILAPTDPVLASEVQLTHINDKDELRFGLTSEGGINDALAFPFVYFGLFFLQDNNLENWFSQWVLIDLLWAITAGLGMGIAVARGISLIEQYLQRFHPADSLMEDFVALATILLTYSLTELINGYGFLAVFVAGVEMQRRCRHINRRLSQLEFTEKIEKLLEVGTILLLGTLIRLDAISTFSQNALIVAGLLIFVVRPLGVWISTIGSHLPTHIRFLLGWFGIRGVGSIYYLSYALGHDIDSEIATSLSWITYITIIVSVILHGISSTPLMNWYNRNLERQHTGH